ncbi:MAG: DISARM system SNF2-like helicase DrmD, partial [Gammaproteobacteria bacterium]
RKDIDMLERILAESPTLEGISQVVQDRVRMAAPRLFADLWSHIREEADAKGDQATRKLRTRGQEEAEALRAILETQRSAILRELDHRGQLTLDFTETERQQREQFEQGNRHMEGRLAVIDKEIAEEPARVESLYEVIRHRLEPVGLVCLWPETRG